MPKKIDHHARLAELETAKVEAERLHREAQAELASGTGSAEAVRSRREAVQEITDKMAGVEELIRLEAEREKDAAASNRKKERAAAFEACNRELKARFDKAIEIQEAIEVLAKLIQAFEAHNSAAIQAAGGHLPTADRIALRENVDPPSFLTNSELVQMALEDAGILGGNGMGRVGNHNLVEKIRTRNGAALSLIAQLIAEAEKDA